MKSLNISVLNTQLKDRDCQSRLKKQGPVIYFAQETHLKYKYTSLIVAFLWRRKWQPTPVFLPGESHGQRSMVGYSPWAHKELDMTERLHFHFDKDLLSLCFVWVLC